MQPWALHGWEWWLLAVRMWCVCVDCTRQIKVIVGRCVAGSGRRGGVMVGIELGCVSHKRIGRGGWAVDVGVIGAGGALVGGAAVGGSLIGGGTVGGGT
eukprot:scaffold36272_cov116-Isochrysis_galbana.AAC.1